MKKDYRLDINTNLNFFLYLFNLFYSQNSALDFWAFLS